MKEIVVGIADGKVALDKQILVSYALGSCVGVCLYDRRRKIAGMAHIVLPDMQEAVAGDNPYKFAKEGIERLIKDMERRGARRKELIAKIAGGATMFKVEGVQWQIGKLNVEAVKRTLVLERITVKGEDTGKDYGRTIRFFAEDGTLEIKTMRHKLLRI